MMLRLYQQLLFSCSNDRPCQTVQDIQVLLLLSAEWRQTEYEFRVVPWFRHPVEQDLPHAVIQKFSMFENQVKFRSKSVGLDIK